MASPVPAIAAEKRATRRLIAEWTSTAKEEEKAGKEAKEAKAAAKEAAKAKAKPARTVARKVTVPDHAGPEQQLEQDRGNKEEEKAEDSLTRQEHASTVDSWGTEQQTARGPGSKRLRMRSPTSSRRMRCPSS